MRNEPVPATSYASHHAALAAAQAEYDQHRVDEALTAVRTLAASDPPSDSAPLAAQIARLRCLAAFRVGEMAESADAATDFLAATGDAGDAVTTHPAGLGGPARADDDDARLAEARRLDVLCVSVLAAGELLRFEQMLLHLRLALQTAQRGGTLAEWVRARGTAAAAFTLLGDPWAAWRLTAELAGTFQGLADQPRLETTARNNHCSTCLLLARMARAAGDPPAADEALAHAEASLRRMREILAVTRDSRGAAFADVNEADLALQQGGGARALVLLRGAAEGAVARGLRGHARWLTLLEAEALVSVGDPEQALQRALPLIDQLGEGQELAMRIRAHEVLHHACNATREVAAARVHLAQAQTLERQQRYRQLQVQSLHLRERLDLEHLYRFR